jgi:hypothetical protein
LIVPAVRKYPSIRFLNIVVGLLSVLSVVLDLRPSEKSGANRGKDLVAPLISPLCHGAKCVETTNLHHPSNKSTRSPLPLPTGLLTRIAAQFRHIRNSPRDMYRAIFSSPPQQQPTSQASPGHKTTTHKQPPDTGSESASFSPAFLALSTAINKRLAEEQLHPYLYLEPKESSTTVVVSSSGILPLS